jgi:uncharacterized membrane protein required for colicin V production
MGLIIDIIAICFLIVSALVAYYKGFVKTFFGFVSVVLSILLACCFSKQLAVRIKNSTEIDEWLVHSIVEAGQGVDIESAKKYTILSGDDISGEIVIEQEATSPSESGIQNAGLIDFIETLPESVGNIIDLEEAKEQTLLSIATKISDIVISVLAWVIIYFVVRIIVAVVTAIFDGIMNLPILKSINNLAGLVIGAIVGVFRIYLLLAIIYFITNVTNLGFFVNIIQTSGLVNAMYNNNLIINLIF